MGREYVLEAYCAFSDNDIEGVCYSLPFVVKDSDSNLCFFCDSESTKLSSLKESNLNGLVFHFVNRHFLINPKINGVFQDGARVFIADRGAYLLNQIDITSRD